MFTKQRQKELKELYLMQCAEEWNDNKMIKYCKSKCACIVELENKHIINIEKPSIKKDFCFGYGLYGTSTDEEYQEAAKMEQYARTQYNYFMEKNLEEISNLIKEFESVLDETEYKECYTFKRYSGEESQLLNDYRICKSYQSPNNAEFNYLWGRMVNVEKMTSADIKNMIAGLKLVKSDFIKRLNNYLKKYGLSKLNTWTYLVD